MSYYRRNNDVSLKSLILLGAICIILIIGMRSCSRSSAHMIYLDDGYCYHEDSYIIYIESITGRYDTDTVYIPYYDEDGNMAKYDVDTGEWIPVDPQ